MSTIAAPSTPSSRWLPLALIGAAAIAYGTTAARVVVAPDNGEFATLYAVGGVAHPSGYPLYVLWLRAWRWLPASSPAHGAALATVLLGVLALVLVYRVSRAWGASREAASLVLAAHAFSTRAWVLSTYAEVFALNAVLAAAIVLVARTDDARITGVRRAALLGALAGLGLSNHHSIVLLAPIGLWGVVRGIREAGDRRVTAIAAPLGGLLVGLTPYAYTMAIARHPEGHWVWGDASTLSGLWFHFRRGEYGTTTLTLHSTSPDRLGQVTTLVVALIKDLFALPLVAIGGAVMLKRRAAGAGEDRMLAIGRLLLFASVLLAGPAFVSLFGISTRGLDRQVVERFWLLPQTLLAILIAPLVDPVLASVFRRRWTAPVLAALLVAFGALFSYLDVREHHRPAQELYLRNTLRIAPPRAIILGTGDHRLDGFLYTRRALGLRPDVDYIDVVMLRTEWYRRQTSRTLGVPIVAPIAGSLDTRAVADQLLATGRPLFLANVFSPAIQSEFPVYPYGTLLRVLPKGAPLPDPLSVEAENLALFEQFTFDEVRPSQGTWAGELQTTYTRPWEILSPIFAQAGLPDHAADCRLRIEQLSPIAPAE